MRTWPISWAITPSSSLSSISSSSPVVAATIACAGSRPVANALGAGSCTMNTLGIGVPVWMDRFSTMRHRRGSSAFVISTPPAIATACLVAMKYWNTANSAEPTSTMTKIPYPPRGE